MNMILSLNKSDPLFASTCDGQLTSHWSRDSHCSWFEEYAARSFHDSHTVQSATVDLCFILCVIDDWWLGEEAAGGESNNIGAEAIEETGDDPEEPAEEKKKTKVL